MKSQKYPLITVTIAILTATYSLYVNFLISGSLFGHVTINQLKPYGGITFGHLWNMELWRLLTSQLIHVKQLHMVFNVISFFLMGIIVEKHIGTLRFFVLWFAAGTLGTLTSTLTAAPPWNLATGASQAVFGVAAFAIVILWKKVDTTVALKLSVAFALIPSILLDLLSAGYPKIGHIVGFATGLCIGSNYIRKTSSQTQS